ncbi:hypothetical protein LLH06_03485 [Mucilaginibacter daejeonensis]|uniref:hypothetical protein n=1 Tax=Mucilaginibacter daejeonensis TaxID=398049 RepID=UPI001D17712B|nr:hypothetical protein [Mucilaginibacter daejeonensis]UEG54033.1 hypothetical protein LLH06_03485 [Mucilaginibacter daejeonensis]
MYFPKLIELVHKDPKTYSPEIVAKLDDFLGNFESGTTFRNSGLNFYVADFTLVAKILTDLEILGLIAQNDDESVFDEETGDNIDQGYQLLEAPQKKIDKNYQEYISKKRQIDSFSIIYERTVSQHSGALTLIDLKGYSKNIKDGGNNPLMLSLIDKIQEMIDSCIRPYFLNSYSGIEIKHNGDGWFLYFLKEEEAYEFLENFITSSMQNPSIKSLFKSLSASLKCYIHHAKEIEKIYKVDSLRFDMEGKDVILIHMLEKPIEKSLYEGVIDKSSNFIAITEGVRDKIGENANDFLELKNVKIDIKDADRNLKVDSTGIRIFYREFAS